MKFIADCMLGKLAKWLRLIGCDTEYVHDAQDDELVRRALREDRILLTRDGTLAGRRMVRGRSFLIESEETGKQLRQVIERFGIRIDSDGLFTRCIICNEPMEDVPKLSVKRLVPPYVYKTQERFGRCPSCGKVYWRGTHVEHVIRALGGVS